MATALRQMFSDTSTVPLITTAVATAAYASWRANDALWKQRTSSSRSTILTTTEVLEDHTHMLQGDAALAFPIIATLSLTLLFFFLRSVGALFTALSTVSGFFALLFTVWPFAEMISRRFFSRWTTSVDGLHSVTAAIAVPPTLVVLFVWLLSGNWFANNVIGIALCILFASVCKVPNLKVATILFSGLFVYDIFFVFFSERLFGRNVMVEVATTAPTNPASTLASWLHLPISPVKTLALPAKLIIPTMDGKHFAILGLGDIILPEVLFTYLLNFDLTCRPTSLSTGYFVYGLIAYMFALALSFFCNYAFRSAQPALLYIVPAVLIVTIIFAMSRSHVRALWLGLPLPHSSRTDLTSNRVATPFSNNSGSTEIPASEVVSLLDDKLDAPHNSPPLSQVV